MFISFGILVTTTAAILFKNRERWAWYALWIVPTSITLLAITVFTSGGIFWITQSFFVIISVLTLLFSRNYYLKPIAH